MSILLVAIANDAMDFDVIRNLGIVTGAEQCILATPITVPMKIKDSMDAMMAKQILEGNLPTGVTLAPKLRGCVMMLKIG